MAYFYKNDQLHIGTPLSSQPVAEILKNQSTPVYLYNLDDIQARAMHLKSAFGQKTAIHFAMKANSNPQILKMLATLGLGADTVSIGEIKRAMECGFEPKKIIFSGVGKTKAELKSAIQIGIKQINVESVPELLRIFDLAEQAQKQHHSDLPNHQTRFQPVSIALRINPDVNPKTHPYITTGFRENKFGLDLDALNTIPWDKLQASDSPVKLRGLTMHIGSQLLELDAVFEAIDKMKTLFLDLRAQGFQLDRFDIGGGLGIQYQNADVEHEMNLALKLGTLALKLEKDLSAEIMIEPGRWLVGRAGLLCAQVQYVKLTAHKRFVILGSGMNHLLRPALYQAEHRVLPLSITAASAAETHEYDIVGPICESADVLAKNVSLGQINEDDWLCLADAGAYGFTMASGYNLHDLPVELTHSTKG